MARWCIVQNQYPTLSKMLTLNERAKRQWKHCTFERLENHHTLPQNERTKQKERATTKLLNGDISFSNITYLVNILVLS